MYCTMLYLCRAVCTQNDGLYHENVGWLLNEWKCYGGELNEKETREESDTSGGNKSEC
jgi:hypothetical protein